MAESAKEELDGYEVRGRPIRVRFAVHGASVRVKELSPYVSNELLYQVSESSFCQIGALYVNKNTKPKLSFLRSRYELELLP